MLKMRMVCAALLLVACSDEPEGPSSSMTTGGAMGTSGGSGDASVADASGSSDAGAQGTTAGDGSADVDAGSGGDADAGAGEPADPGAGSGAVVTLPPGNAGFDYQIGGAYPPPDGVGVVSRDRLAEPAPGLYNICYVNGFQTQPDETDFWLDDHPDLILRDGGGEPVVDSFWGEMLLDIGSADKRTQLAGIVGEWIAQCKSDGFDAVEIDNLDTYTRSDGALDESDAVAFIRLLADRAHAEGLAIAQKNTAELSDRKQQMGTDFVVAEECNAWDECDVYTDAYDDEVFIIEYDADDFATGCAAYPELSIVYRDLDVSPAGSGDYVYEGC